jgi:hypothetical protein
MMRTWMQSSKSVAICIDLMPFYSSQISLYPLYDLRQLLIFS